MSLGEWLALLMVMSTKVFESANILAICTLWRSEEARQSDIIDLNIIRNDEIIYLIANGYE